MICIRWEFRISRTERHWQHSSGIWIRVEVLRLLHRKALQLCTFGNPYRCSYAVIQVVNKKDNLYKFLCLYLCDHLLANMGNSPSLSSRSSVFRGHQKAKVLLVKANVNGDHHVSKYQRYRDNRCLQCLASFRWKLNMSMTYRPFSFLSLCRIPGDVHQFLYRMTLSEFLFWSAAITLLTLYPFAYCFENVRGIGFNRLFQWHPDRVFDWDLGPYSKFGVATSICFVITWVFALRHSPWNILFGLSFGINS